MFKTNRIKITKYICGAVSSEYILRNENTAVASVCVTDKHVKESLTHQSNPSSDLCIHSVPLIQHLKNRTKNSWRSLAAILCLPAALVNSVMSVFFRDSWAVFCLFPLCSWLNKVRMYSHNLASLEKHFRLLKCWWNECQIQFRLEQIPQDSGYHRFKQIPGTALPALMWPINLVRKSVHVWVWHLNIPHQYTAGKSKHLCTEIFNTGYWNY